MIEKLPTLEANIGNIYKWTLDNSTQLSMETLFNTVKPRPDVLLVLVKMLRIKIRNCRAFHVSTFRERSEDSLRSEVHSQPREFCFASAALNEYSPIHLAEMLSVVLRMLKDAGIDAYSKHPGTGSRPELPRTVPKQSVV